MTVVTASHPPRTPHEGTPPLDAPARPASSLLLVRPGEEGGLEVFALQRAATMAFSAHATAFPGGRVDPADELPPALWDGVDLAGWADRLGLPGEPEGARSTLWDLAPERAAGRLLAAVVRETFEEVGVLLARDAATGVPVDAQRVAALPAELRAQVERHEVDFGAFLAHEGLAPDVGALVPWSRWITPPGGARRYDTFFFVVRLPAGQSPERVSTEAAHHCWATPAALLERFRAGAVNLMAPTWWQLRALADAEGCEDVVPLSRSLEPLRAVMLRANAPRPDFTGAADYLRDLAAFRAAATVEESPDNVL